MLYFISYPYEATGSQRSLFTTVSHLPKQIKSHLLLTDNGFVQELFQSANIPTTIIRPTGPLQQYGKAAFRWSLFKKVYVFLFHYLPFQWRIWQFLRTEQFDIVHCNSHRSTVLVALAAKLAGAKLVTHLRNEVRFRNIFTHIYEAASDSIITVSKAIVNDIAAKYRHKAAIIYNALQQPTISDADTRKINFAPNKLHLICLSLIVPHKGLHHLIDALAHLKKKGYAHQLEVHCLGAFLEHHADYKRFLAAKVEGAQLENIHFIGYKKEPLPYLAAADLVVLPSISEEELNYDGTIQCIIGNEGLPRVLLEACGFGKAAIAFDVPGVREIIETSKSGFIIEEGNSQALADAIEVLINAPERLVEMGENAKTIYRSKFIVAQNVTATVQVYQSLLD
ncbi:MAG: glycosyltransferase family 4 protein [Bacteroidota bacterium]